MTEAGDVTLSYDSIETQIVEALPELHPLAERFWADQIREVLAGRRESVSVG
jgi:hypothetical protein